VTPSSSAEELARLTFPFSFFLFSWTRFIYEHCALSHAMPFSPMHRVPILFFPLFFSSFFVLSSIGRALGYPNRLGLLYSFGPFPLSCVISVRTLDPMLPPVPLTLLVTAFFFSFLWKPFPTFFAQGISPPFWTPRSLPHFLIIL